MNTSKKHYTAHVDVTLRITIPHAEALGNTPYEVSQAASNLVLDDQGGWAREQAITLYRGGTGGTIHCTAVGLADEASNVLVDEHRGDDEGDVISHSYPQWKADLRAAATAVVDAWSGGDLAAAVRRLDHALACWNAMVEATRGESSKPRQGGAGAPE